MSLRPHRSLGSLGSSRSLLPALAVLLAGALGAGCSAAVEGEPDGLGVSAPTTQPSTVTAEPAPEPDLEPTTSLSARPSRPRVVGTAATGLSAPWGLTFLPDGSALVGERDTTRVLAVDGGRVREVGRVDAASPGGEAGLLGLAASPSYAEDGLVFAYYTTASDNRVVRMSYDGRRLGAPDPILTGIPRGPIHDGGRIAFGPDGHLYVATGEIGQPELSQDPASLAGKILRITAEGKPAPGNPRPRSVVWSMGHRNVQGLAFDGSDRLWASEFGSQQWDELNLIEAGGNYGWPLVEGRGEDDRFRNPFVQWRTSEASPSGLAFHNGALWMASLRGARLWLIPLTAAGTGTPRDFLVGDYGRLRTVAVAPDGNLWLTTSNRDGRGDPQPGDDRILIVSVSPPR